MRKRRFTYRLFKGNFDKQVRKLQATCKHERVSDWMEEWWAPGHSTGASVKHCKICNKRTHIQKTMIQCLDCGVLQRYMITPCVACKSENIRYVGVTLDYTWYDEKNDELQERIKNTKDLLEQVKNEEEKKAKDNTKARKGRKISRKKTES